MICMYEVSSISHCSGAFALSLKLPFLDWASSDKEFASIRTRIGILLTFKTFPPVFHDANKPDTRDFEQ